MTVETDLRRGVLAIARQAAAAGEALPGEHELARRLGANRPQVRKVLAELEQPGILRRSQGAATTVDPLALRMAVRLEEQVEHTALLERLGYAAGVVVVSDERGELGQPLAELMASPADQPVLRARKVWTADGRPAMVADNTLLLPRGAAPVDAQRSVFDVAAQAWGEAVQWEVATPGVENLDRAGAELLDMDEGAACMTLTIVGMLRSGARVLHAVERHHPDIVQYSVVRRFPEPWS